MFIPRFARDAASTFALLILFLAVTPVPGWSIEGHQIIAIIAETRLNESTWKQLDEILGKGSDGEQANISDAEICGWADEIRRQRRDTAPYHFVNIPHDAIGYDENRDDPEGDNIVAMIEKFKAVLVDTSAPKEKRREAVLFLVHLVGDIHQPLHCAERNGDKGGNGKLVFFRDREAATNLHKVWDGDLLQSYLGTRKIGRLNDYAELLSKMVNIDDEQTWNAQPVKEWANESHRVAVDHVYRDIPAGGHPPKITPEYVKSREKIVDKQLQRAGVRLAMVLNDALSDPVAASMPATRAASRPATQKATREPRVVFLLDASGSMTDRAEFVKTLMKQKIEALDGDAAFSIVIARDDEVVQLSPTTLSVNAANKARAVDFLLNSYFIVGKTDPILAFENCFKKRPSQLIVISDGFDPMENVPSLRDMIINRASAVRAKVDLILLWPRPDVEFVKYAKEIADKTRGTVTILER